MALFYSGSAEWENSSCRFTSCRNCSTCHCTCYWQYPPAPIPSKLETFNCIIFDSHKFLLFAVYLVSFFVMPDFKIICFFIFRVLHSWILTAFSIGIANLFRNYLYKYSPKIFDHKINEFIKNRYFPVNLLLVSVLLRFL